jgi:hypothetical protein
MGIDYSDLAKIVGAALLFAVTWAASVAFVYWDAARRELPILKIHTWTAAAALAPFIGFALYLVFRLLGLIFSLLNRFFNRKPVRVTVPKQPSKKWTPLPTLAASDFGSGTIAMPAAGITRERRRWKLVILSGAEKGKEFPLDSFPVRFGRGSLVDVSLDMDLGVSREHCEIYEKESSLVLRDLGSTHGTQVNGKPVIEKPLVSGDTIQLGLTVFELTQAES